MADRIGQAMDGERRVGVHLTIARSIGALGRRHQLIRPIKLGDHAVDSSGLVFLPSQHLFPEQRTKNKGAGRTRTGCPLGEPRTGCPLGEPRTENWKPKMEDGESSHTLSPCHRVPSGRHLVTLSMLAAIALGLVDQLAHLEDRDHRQQADKQEQQHKEQPDRADIGREVPEGRVEHLPLGWDKAAM